MNRPDQIPDHVLDRIPEEHQERFQEIMAGRAAPAYADGPRKAEGELPEAEGSKFIQFAAMHGWDPDEALDLEGSSVTRKELAEKVIQHQRAR